MHIRRGGERGSNADIGQVNRKRINDALDKHLERSSPSSSRVGLVVKDKDRLSVLSANGKPSLQQRPVEESETDSEESDVSGSDGDDLSWISWFCNLRGNEFFCEIDEDYIQDDFNLCGLSSQVPYYDHALDLILDVESSHGDVFTEEQHELVESAAEMLYGLIHVRYVLTTKGQAAMLEKYKKAEFGRCPRVYCSGQPCLAVGQSDIPRQSTVKIYCPKCEDIYAPRSKYQDRAFLNSITLVVRSSVFTQPPLGIPEDHGLETVSYMKTFSGSVVFSFLSFSLIMNLSASCIVPYFGLLAAANNLPRTVTLFFSFCKHDGCHFVRILCTSTVHNLQSNNINSF